MKRLVYILLPVICCLLAAACSHESEEVPLYLQYASRTDLTVAQVSGYRLNDTVRVDVVLMVADDDAAWQQLKEEFRIEGQEGMESWLGDTKQPAKRVKWSGTPVLRAIASHSRRTLGFYLLDNEAQYNALIDYQIEMMNNE